VSGPEIFARGFSSDDSAFDEIRAELHAVLTDALAEEADDTYRMQQLLRRTIGRWVNKTYRRRPMIVPVVIAS
jgi:ribonuclease J